MNKRIILVLAMIALLVSTIIAAPAFAAKNGSRPADKNTEYIVPANKSLRAVLTTPVNSADIMLGQTVSSVLGQDFVYNKTLIAPAESMLYGTVVEVKKAVQDEPGYVYVRYTSIVTPYGIIVPISAVIKTKNQQGKICASFDENGVAQDIDIPVNTPLELVLIQPITVNPEIYNSNY